ncbi:MAG: hypothetical protein GAK34_03376 [Delftia tsuruhatensis]|nr:MAG: hypothetical protein GAK34_03376 [Delftia tsuruhatensis]
MLAGKGVTTLEDEGAVLVAVEKLAERAGMLADLGLSCGGDVETVGRLGRMGASTWQFQRWAAGA